MGVGVGWVYIGDFFFLEMGTFEKKVFLENAKFGLANPFCQILDWTVTKLGFISRLKSKITKFGLDP